MTTDAPETRKRRAKGSGALYQLPDGRWRGALNLPPKDGKRQRKIVYGDTQEEARRKLTAETRKRDQGFPVAPTGETVGSYLEKWLDDTAKGRVRPATYSWYGMHVKLNIRPDPIARVRLEKLQPADVRGLMQRLSKRGLAPRSVAGTRATLRAALNDAVRDRILAWNAAQHAKPPRQKPREARWLTPDQAKAVLGAAKGDSLEGFLWAALGTGARSGELLGLKWEDVSLDGPDGWGKIRIAWALQRVDGELRRVEPKSKSGVRTVDVAPPVVAALRRHHVRQLEDQLLSGTEWQETGFVFTSARGTGMDTSQVWEKFQKVLRRAGLPRFRVHDLRHSAAAFMIAQGVSPRVVMEQLGHSSITLTLGTYGHALAAPKREAAAALAGVLAG